MRVAILHEELEWSEKEFKRKFEEKGSEVKLFDVRDTDTSEILDYNPEIAMNRVYASVANRNYEAIPRTLKMLKRLEDEGVEVINSFEASKSDYDKHYAYDKMRSSGIYTPKTKVIDSSLPAPDIDFPAVIKRARGGRGKDVKLVRNREELRKAYSVISEDENYKGKIILQEFLRSKEGLDHRVCIFRDQFLFGNSRTLIEKNSDIKWMGSVSSGSELRRFNREENKDIVDLCIKTTESIDADLNVMDVISTENGLAIIENNLTPNFRPRYKEELGFDPVGRIVDGILDPLLVKETVK
ncbi:MAG: RimK family alpha-L-glutamate ligase [Candidatus Aenigmatarchaeota archaeon]